MSVDLFPIVLWGGTGLLLAGLCGLWSRGDARARRDAELGRRWARAVVWNADTTARVVRVARVDSGIAWLDDGDGEIAARLPEGLTAVDVGWYLHVAGWTSARRAAKGGRTATLGAEKVRDAFPPHTPVLYDRLSGRGERRPGWVSRLLGLRGL